MSDDTVYLGTFIRNTIEHPELFSFKCPHCGETLYPYGYNGSPLSGRVDLQAICDCGWSGFEMVSGWRIRSEALKAAQHSDTWRRRLFKLKSGTPPQSTTCWIGSMKSKFPPLCRYIAHSAFIFVSLTDNITVSV